MLHGWAFTFSGEQHGYNIPEVTQCEYLPQWLLEENQDQILACENDRDLPQAVRRVLCDGYICMYQSPQMMMYK